MSEPRTAADPSTAEGVFTLVLAKEDFKFSSAHFTLFGAEDAETLHGHNYRVAVELVGRRLDDDEMLASLVEVKRAIRAACARLDERTLIPTASRHLTIEQIDDHVEVAYGARRYRLPTDDVLLLDLGNTSIEAFARHLWRELTAVVDLRHLDALGVEVGETAGQSCWYRAPVLSAPQTAPGAGAV